jgi:PAS domain S-box-containing protein
VPYSDLKLVSRFYAWIVGSLYRLISFIILLAALMAVISLLFNPLILGLAAAAILLAMGNVVYNIHRSMTALDLPAVDRFFQMVPCYLSIQNKNLKIIRTNMLFRDDFGERLGEKCHKVYKGSDKICPDCPVLKTFADGKTYSCEETVITKDGKPAQMIVYTTPVYDEKGKIVAVMEMSTNIAKIKELQSQIEAGHKEYRALFDRVPCYISIQDRNLRIIKANEKFQQEFGDYAGRFCYEVFKSRDAICPECHVEKTLRDGKIRSRETSVMRKDGTLARLVAYSSPIYDEKGEISSVMEMSTDITEIKRLEQELADMGKTIALMAHRVKNILMGLEGGIFVVNTGIEDGDDAMVKKGWGMIQRNVENVSRIVKDLLYCSKERKMNFEIIDPGLVVRNVFDLFEDRARKSNVSFDLELPDSLPQGRFDPEALHSLLTNLVINALDACINDATGDKDRHHVIIRSRCESDGKFIFEVEDNGTGIPGHVGESVFEDFFSTKGREGTGLGLLVARRIADEHGGTITFRSVEGKGTVFHAKFPPR